MLKIKKIQQKLRQRPKTVTFAVLIISVSIVHGAIYISHNGHADVMLRSERIESEDREQLVQAVLDKSTQLTLMAGEHVVQTNIYDFGIGFDEQTVEDHIAPAWHWHNVIPILGTKNLLEPVIFEPTYSIDEQKLAETTLALSSELSTQPIDAKLEQVDGSIDVIPEQVGYAFASQTLYDALHQQFSDGGSDVVELAAEPVQPSLTAEELEEVAKKYENVANTELAIKIDDVSFKLDPSSVLDLIQVNAEDVTLNSEKLNQLIAVWSKEVAITPGVTQVEYLDDQVVSTVAGAQGRRLDEQAVLTALEKWVASPESTTLQLSTVPISPKIVETRTYTKSSLGLQKLLDEWAAGHSGTYRIAVRERGGQGREASVNADTPTVMASTYKVFLSVVAYKLIENGELAANTIIDNGKNVEECIEGGIVHSENTCMAALGWHIGWAKVDNVLYDMGFRNMSLNNYNSDKSFNGDKVAPAQQQAKLLMQLADTSLINTAHTNSLVGYMKSQVYRSGIPAGSTGSAVANKVGFLYSYIHDMGIVYGPKSTYALVILTEDSDWSAISDLASEIYTFMNE